MKVYREVKLSLPPYKDELSFPGVAVGDLEYSQLSTFMEPYEFDITNAAGMNKKECNSNKEHMTFKARQERLNHKSFTFIIQISSEKNVNAAVRIFLGPKFDHNNRLIKLNESRLDFIELDSFLCDLKSGQNFLLRKDHEFARTSKDPIPTRKMTEKINDALKSGDPLEISDAKPRNNWPTNLLLPKGKKEGLEMKLYIIVTKYKMMDLGSSNVTEFRNTIGITNSALIYDEMSFGFPFDRKINEQMLRIPNVKAFDVKIYHE